MSKVNENRRRFLITAGLGSVGMAATVLAPAVAQDEPAAKTPEAGDKGYHLTDHIRKYYETTRF